MAIYCADFETTTDVKDCRVWAWGISDIEAPEEVTTGVVIETFMNYILEHPGIVYFHNIKFDGNFIIYWLFRNGYTYNTNKREMRPGQFNALISDMGTWYTIDIYFKPTDTGIAPRVEIRDSAKIIPLPIEAVPSAFGLKEQKLEIDYNEFREIGHELTEQEKEYLCHDVIILSKAVKFMCMKGQTKLTAGANALNDFKKRFDKKEWNRLFPALNPIVDRDIRMSYKGGWTYLVDDWKNKEVKEGCVYDVNSMYPWAMKYCALPWGNPVFFKGEYKENKNYPLYIINFVAEFKLKPNRLPSIQIKHSLYFADNEYIKSTEVPMVLTLTSVDFELFKHNYDYKIIEYVGGYMFKSKVGMFAEYIDYWYEQKTLAKKEGNKGLEKIAKLMLNSLYGKFGARLTGKSKYPIYSEEDDKVLYKLSEEEDRKGGYLPVASFITSYCRDKIIRGAEACGDRFIYADTDSLHILGTTPPAELDVDEYRLGAFKLEERFIRAKFIRQKTYLEVYLKKNKKTGLTDEEINLKCCGMPDKMKKSITEGMFFEGAIFEHKEGNNIAPKLVPLVVPGGVVLKETTFQIKKTKTTPELEVDFGDAVTSSIMFTATFARQNKARKT